MIVRTARLALLLLALAAPGWSATSTPAILGSDGTVYRLWAGTFGEIFGANPAFPPATPILALDLTPPGQTLLRYLVPGTEGPEVESSPVILFDSRSGAVHAVWSTRVTANQTYSRFNLRSYSPAGWSPLLEISGGSLTEKSSLRLALSEDSYSTTVAGVETRIARRVLHLVWTEDDDAGSVRAFYSPVLFLNGSYIGWNPVIALDGLANAETPSTVPVGAELRRAPTLTATPSGRVVISFVHSQTSRLVALDLQQLPGELGQLAEMARGHIVELAAIYGTTDRPTLAELARGHIVELATRFHPAAANHLGNETGAYLLAADPGADGPTLAEMARGHIVELGREILSAGLADVCPVPGWILEIPPLVPIEGMDFSHFLGARQSHSWELPSDAPAAARILLSLDGDRALLAWQNVDRLNYRETLPDGTWSELRTIDPAQMSLGEAWAALERRALGF